MIPGPPPAILPLETGGEGRLRVLVPNVVLYCHVITER